MKESNLDNYSPVGGLFQRELLRQEVERNAYVLQSDEKVNPNQEYERI